MKQRATRPAEAPRAGSEPLRPIALWGRQASRAGAFLGVLVGLVGHAGLLHAIASLDPPDRSNLVGREEDRILDVDVVDEPDEPLVDEVEAAEPEPPESPMTEDEPVAAAEQGADEAEPTETDTGPYDEDVAAAPSEAADVLTSDSTADEPVDLTGEAWSIVDGKGSGPIYGYKSRQGRAKQATFDKRARLDGSPGGKGSRAAPGSGANAVDRSRPAGLVGGRAWSCPFPPQADRDQINSAVAVIVVRVSPAGLPTSVRVVSDPGYGFGAMAKQCAYGRRYQPALDSSGQAIASSTPPINVRFRR